MSILPKNILILRHGQSMGNADETLYATTPDWKVSLSERGRRQARDAGRRMQQLINPSQNILYYVSPYLRTKETLEEIQSQISNPTLFVREEPRLREQDFGNFQDPELIQAAKLERPKFGRFFFRFPNGESGADVFDRVSAFSGTFLQDIQQISRVIGEHKAANTTAILVTHGITGRLFVMRWLHWSVDDFEKLHNPPNCGLLLMKRTPDGNAYELSDESRDLIKAPRFDRDSGYVGSGLKLGELLKTQHPLSRKDRDAFDDLPHSAWGV